VSDLQGLMKDVEFRD